MTIIVFRKESKSELLVSLQCVGAEMASRCNSGPPLLFRRFDPMTDSLQKLALKINSVGMLCMVSSVPLMLFQWNVAAACLGLLGFIFGIVSLFVWRHWEKKTWKERM